LGDQNHLAQHAKANLVNQNTSCRDVNPNRVGLKRRCILQKLIGQTPSVIAGCRSRLGGSKDSLQVGGSGLGGSKKPLPGAEADLKNKIYGLI